MWKPGCKNYITHTLLTCIVLHVSAVISEIMAIVLLTDTLFPLSLPLTHAKEHYYDPASHNGFIEMKLRNLRRDMEESQRRYRRKSRSGGAVALIMSNIEEDVSEWVTLAKRMKPSPQNLSTIKHAMDQTYTHRRIWITTQSPTVAEIFHQYPRFIDMPHLVRKFLIL